MTGNCLCRPGTGGANLRAYAARHGASHGAVRSLSTCRNISEAPGTRVTAGPVPTGKVTLTSAVSEEYKSPFSFKGRIEQVKIELK